MRHNCAKAMLGHALMFLLFAGVVSAPTAGAESNASDALENGFADPPMTARPRVWWHWLDGNVTQEGISKDLHWMKRIGIGGLQNFDAGLGSRQIVADRLVFMTPDWKSAFRHTASLADQLGLELAIAASPGWSETGGPWVQPRDGMKKLVWSETVVQGGTRLSQRLPAPPSVTGPFQSLRGGLQSAGTFYADAIVLAVPHEVEPSATPKFSLQDGSAVDTSALTDGDFESHVRVDMGTAEQPGTLTIAYDGPRRVQSVTIFVRDASPPFADPIALPRLEVREGDGWRRLVDIPLSHVTTTASFAPVSAREFRLVMAPLPSSQAGASSNNPSTRKPPKVARIAELALSPAPKVDAFELKAGFALARDYYALSSHIDRDEPGVGPNKVIDLTDRMKPDGTLDWAAPRGRWKVLRMGYSLLGKTNHPAAAEATGLEVDKYDRAAVGRYIDTYLGMYRDATGPELMGKRGLQAVLTDSIEVGASNWTPSFIEQFERLRSYDPRPWLPTLTGVIVGSRFQSDAFLYDFRRTLADLIASEHYGQVARSAHENQLKVYGESLEGTRPSLGDDIAMRSSADIPMGALWTYPRGAAPSFSAAADIRGAASVAHVYGQNLVAAESMTSSAQPWAHAPSDLRRIIDYEFAHGVNLPVIHTSVHQPDERPPGLSLALFGQYFTRHETWAEMARPWVDYIARNSFLLQQGRHVADVAYFHGEEAPLMRLFGDEPVRYAYDYVNADALLNQITVNGRELAAKGGARYQALYLGGSSQKMTLTVLRRLAEFAESGATIIGKAPLRSPALRDDPTEHERLVRRLWSGKELTRVGAGQVIASGDIESALASVGIVPDFNYVKPHPDSEVLFVHRRIDAGDVYYVNNRRDRGEHIEASFRVSGKQPEIWRADTGRAEEVSYRIEGDSTVVPLELLPEESFFVVFRKPAPSISAQVAKPALKALEQLDGPWKVEFQPGRGAPDAVSLAPLSSLSDNPQPGIKYFSGVATYRTTFRVPKRTKLAAAVVLDLGQVGDVAEVRVNGKPVGTAWKPPYRLEIGDALKRGANELEVRVANLWVNRLIGDAQPGAQKVAFTVVPTYKADAVLRPSGLIGPVRLLIGD
jgi:hypothetical protein